MAVAVIAIWKYMVLPYIIVYVDPKTVNTNFLMYWMCLFIPL